MRTIRSAIALSIIVGLIAAPRAVPAAPVLTNSAAFKDAAPDNLIDVRWGWWGPGSFVGGFAPGAALAAPAYPYGYGYSYGCFPYPCAYSYSYYSPGPYSGGYPGYWGVRRAYWGPRPAYWGGYRR